MLTEDHIKFARSLVNNLGAVVSEPVPWDLWTKPLYVGFTTYRGPNNRIWFAAAYQLKDGFDGIIWYGYEPCVTFLNMSKAACAYHSYLELFPTMRPFHRLNKACRAARIDYCNNCGHLFANIVDERGIWAIQHQFNK